jgi:divalent metal cation (Fe/Co/Zn/Cd) transporter
VSGSSPVTPAGLAVLAHGSPQWHRQARLARWLAWLSLACMAAEGATALAAAVAAGSVALLGFGLDSVIEGLASLIVIWRFTGARTLSQTAERHAHKAVAVTFFLLAPYITTDAIWTLTTSEHPQTSWLGIAVATASLIVMPLLGAKKKKIGRQLGSATTSGESTQNILCAYLAAAVLAGLLATTWLGWWWLDPAVGLLIAAPAVREGSQAWRGDDCCP